MVATKANHPPFYTSLKRFGKMTVHPNLDPSGLYATRPAGCDPCLYHPVPLHKVCEITHTNKIDKDPWRYKIELEEWAKNLGYRNQKVLEQRRWQRSLLGPAWHDVPRESYKYEPVCMNVGFGRTFKKNIYENDIPGPGTYYKTKPYKVPYGPHSTRPTFDREEPCRFKDTSPNWSLAPNRYTIIDRDSIAQKSKKIVSLRGPYDLFTGKRDDSTKNHFNTSLKCSAATWPIALKGSLEKYKQSHFGRLNKTGRNKIHRGRNTLADLAMCPKLPTDPGPAAYHPHAPKPFPQYKYGFNSSYDKPPGYKRVIVWPGVGRYNLKEISCGIPGQGHRHVFLSKIRRTIGANLPQPMNTF